MSSAVRVEQTGRFRRMCICALSGGVPRRSLYVAIVVGTILNAINQGDSLVTGRPVDWLKLILTYVVPYCVSTYGAVSYQLREPSVVESSQDRSESKPS